MKRRTDHIEDNEGVPIVLTASRAEMSHYGNNPFLAFVCTFPKALSMRILEEQLKGISSGNGTAKFAPYGLRKVESILTDEFGEGNVVVSHYDDLHRFVGKKTKLVCISTMDPMGLAYVSTTYNHLIGFGGESLNAVEFKKLLAHPSLDRYRPKILVGGAGVWQIRDSRAQEELGIDVLFQGEGEKDIIRVTRKLLAGETIPKYFRASKPSGDEISLIKHASSYGTVEITRGCGRGCKFCSPTMRTRYSLPLENIMEEVGVNVKGGCDTVFTATEDMFLYGSKPGFIPDRQKIVELYRNIASYPGVNKIILSHASLAPIIYDPGILEELTPVLMEKTMWTPELRYSQSFITVEIGIETGSTRLMNKNMPGKALPYSVDDWPELVLQGIGLLNDHDWWPLCTIMTGQPDETEDDVIATLELIDELRSMNAKMFYTPILFIPLEEALLGHKNASTVESMSELQWEVIARSWRNNIDFWMPEKSWLFGTALFFGHWFFTRWKHGRKATRPMMHLAGIPDRSIPMKVLGKCDALYCRMGTGYETDGTTGLISRVR